MNGATQTSVRIRMLQLFVAFVVAFVGWTVATPAAHAAPVAQAPVVSAGFIGLRVGAQGNDVVALQRALIDAGIPLTGGADGVFGAVTRDAVRIFQQGRSMPVTGEVDEATSQALIGTSGSSGSSGSSASSAAGLTQGAQGSAVKELQEKLMARGAYVAGGADGIYGSATARAVRHVQLWFGLPQTGTVDGATSKALGLSGASASSGSAPSPAAGAATSSGSGSYVGMKQGARGADVKAVQQALQSVGTWILGGADGVFGPATTSAVKKFQSVNGLAQNGVIGQREAQILGLTSGSAPAPSAADTSAYLGLKVGSRGAEVKELQSALIKAGVTVRGGADGVFGSVTKSALAQYQKAVGVTASGTVNQGTINKLGLGSSNAPQAFASGGSSGGSSAAAAGYVGLKVGSQGTKVKELQRALQETGLVVRGGADGVFGSATQSALKAFQSVNGIPQTGVTTAKGVAILALGNGGGQSATNPNAGSFSMKHFPVQGLCFFGDTWHAARGGGRLHVGVDIIANEGNELYAVVDGTISKKYWDQPGALSGNGVRVQHASGTYYTYLHMMDFAPGIKVGAKVKAGDVIGWVGNTGSSATPHLHFEIHPNGEDAINPYPHVKAIDACSKR
ncbi:peptidoglycan-binding protein [Ilumatobacter nonamiensis]|uniref:peptidoglycan-binding protein n=1 Tax=Ilumatobacter nonamiensis TaxID=467093 RepID=UPI00130E31F9|nr:peptidoglycan-binding protein [Ilumatobacter nonamiensis]